ncbi:hypothetical protein A5724_11420 [Mycobacterium sp. ACS1612]|uniref:DUF6390 family protein n=1 Tax=Mycobacterium sp. ACS1612 TaxID=1834117 RepID=UPI0007FDEBFD|nr:DUF6390 family protein [Mycobacterium sp. ACS1612]OBF37766.1 hypothetical protein A5724_11420 [Mycobacterium sp. ACS1612]
MTLFEQYAYPPNELGYCGPTGGDASGLAAHAREFDGAWPYLSAIAEAVGACDPLDEEIVHSYWVGGPALAKVDPADLLATLRASFTGQVTGLLDAVMPGPNILAHHSFHVFVVYPWMRFLDRDPATALGVMQDCRIRWGTVESVDGDQVVMTSQPLRYADRMLTLGPPQPERVQWRKAGLALTGTPEPGSIVAAHWNWVCQTLTDDQCTALESATSATLDVVNSSRGDRK